MLPFVILIGGWIGEFLNKFFDLSNMQNNNTSSSGSYAAGSYVDDLLLQVLKINEGAGSQAVEKAYLLKGEKRYTIGYGTTYLYTKTGANFRGNAAVLVSDTLTSLKIAMGYSSLSSEQFARQLIVNHIKFDYTFNKGGAKNFFSQLDNKKIPYYRDFNVALIDVAYMSGSFFSSSKGNALMTMIMQNPNRKNIAFQLFKCHFEYLRGLSAYQANKMGWTKRLLKRYYLVAYGNFNHNHVESNLNTTQKIQSFCISEMGYIINL